MFGDDDGQVIGLCHHCGCVCVLTGWTLGEKAMGCLVVTIARSLPYATIVGRCVCSYRLDIGREGDGLFGGDNRQVIGLCHQSPFAPGERQTRLFVTKTRVTNHGDHLGRRQQIGER